MYKEFIPHQLLQQYIDAFWVVTNKGDQVIGESIMPDGCVDIIFNPGTAFFTDDDTVKMENARAYLVGTMTRCKKIIRPLATHLIGIRFKPGAFSYFYNYPVLKEIVNKTVELDKALMPDFNRVINDPVNYLNQFFVNRLSNPKRPVNAIIDEIYKFKGQIRVDELAKRYFLTGRQLERYFILHLGISPKEFINFVRYLFVAAEIKNNRLNKSLLQIAYENGFYDHSHLTNEIKRYTGLVPSQL